MISISATLRADLDIRTYRVIHGVSPKTPLNKQPSIACRMFTVSGKAMLASCSGGHELDLSAPARDRDRLLTKSELQVGCIGTMDHSSVRATYLTPET